MKKIINRKMYDTETAERIADDSFGGVKDFDYWAEELYLKKTGEFFLYGEGGANSKYSKKLDIDTWGPGETIIPYSEEETKDWLEEHDCAEAYIKLFGVPEE